MSHNVSNDVMKYLKMSGGTASFKSKGKRCILKDGPLRNEDAYYTSKYYLSTSEVGLCLLPFPTTLNTNFTLTKL